MLLALRAQEIEFYLEPQPYISAQSRSPTQAPFTWMCQGTPPRYHPSSWESTASSLEGYVAKARNKLDRTLVNLLDLLAANFLVGSENMPEADRM